MINAFCELCDNTCKTCANYRYECTSCNEHYYLLGTVCGTTCPDGMWADDSTWTCKPCDSTCKTCTPTGLYN